MPAAGSPLLQQHSALASELITIVAIMSPKLSAKHLSVAFVHEELP